MIGIVHTYYYKIQVSQAMKAKRSKGLKGQQALSPGQRPGYKGEGVGCAPHLPRALPWAGSFLAFQAVFAELAKHEL